MASGFGKHQVGRCYKIFSTFEKCMNEEYDSTVCYDFRQQYFNCLHLPSVHTDSEKDLKYREESKDILALAAKALDSAGDPGAKGAPATPGAEGGST